MPVDLNDLEIFAVLVESGGFSAAARALEVPKSTVSRRVARLEAELGVGLVERNTRSMNVTEVGREVYQHCQRIRDEAELVGLTAENHRAAPRGTLRVRASISVGQLFLVPTLKSFKQRYPDIRIELTLLNRQAEILTESFDVAFRVGKLPDSGLISRRLFTSRIQCYAAPNVAEGMAELGPGELPEGVDFATMWGLHSDHRSQLERGHERRAISATPGIICDDFISLRRLLVDGYGVGPLPDYAAREPLAAGQLQRLWPEWQVHAVDVFLIYPSHRGAAPKLRVFIEEVRGEVSGLLAAFERGQPSDV